MSTSNHQTAPDPQTAFAFELTLQALEFQSVWERCSMLANYIGEYVAFEYAQRESAENLISTIANEFLESVVTLSVDSSSLLLWCRQTGGDFRIEVDHEIRTENLAPYVDFLSELNRGNEQVYYLALLTAEERPTAYFNQLGLAMLNHDFGARLSSHFDPETHRLRTELAVSIEALIA